MLRRGRYFAISISKEQRVFVVRLHAGQALLEVRLFGIGVVASADGRDSAHQIGIARRQAQRNNPAVALSEYICVRNLHVPEQGAGVFHHLLISQRPV